MNINDFMFTLAMLFGDKKLFRLLKVAEWYEYLKTSDGKGQKGEKLGYKYTVVNDELVIKFDVKVKENLPVIDNESIRKSSTPIMVMFGESQVTFYGNSLWDCKLSAESETITVISTATKGTKNT